MENVKQVDGKNILVVDPNPTNANINHEDLMIYVNLRADTKSRSIISETDVGGLNIDNVLTNVTTNYSYQKDKNGNPIPLNTEWTKIGGGILEPGEDVGGFGITNIDIDFNSSFMPQIVIDFVDIRGATLFEQGPCSPYAAFFHMPYPRFELTVKGFYGKPVSYSLALVKFNTKFNSDTGNFESRAEFLGYTFAFLADIPIGYAMASVYTPEGKSMLKKTYGDVLKRMESDGTGELDKLPGIVDNKDSLGEDDALRSGPLTIIDLLKGVKKMEELQESISQKDEIKQLTELQKLKVRVNSLLYGTNDAGLSGIMTKLNGDKNNAFTNEISSEKTNSSNFSNRTKMQLKIKGDRGTEYTKNATYIEKFNQLKEYCGTNTTDFLKSALKIEIDEINTIIDNEKLNPSLKINITTNNFSSNSVGLGWSKQPDIDGDGLVFYIDFGSAIVKPISQVLVLIEKEIESKTTEVKDKVDEVVFSNLGYKPTVRNVFGIILANVEAFLQTLVSSSTRAEHIHNLESNIPEGINRKDGKKKIGDDSSTVYPWPTYFRKPTRGTGGDVEAFPSNFPNWEEVRYVEEFIKSYNELLEETDLLDGDVEDKPGFDNFIPMTAFESAALGETNGNRWYNKVEDDNTLQKIYKTIGESAFIIGDYSYLNKLTLWKSQLGFDNDWVGSTPPLFKDVANKNVVGVGRGGTNGNTHPWKSKDAKGNKITTLTNLDLMKKSGELDALNFLSTIRTPKLLQTIINDFNKKSNGEITKTIKETLGDNLVEEKFTDWAGRVTNNEPLLITNQTDLWDYVGSNKKNGENRADWVYHTTTPVYTYRSKINEISANPYNNNKSILLVGSNQVGELSNRDFTINTELLNKTRGTELASSFEKLGYGQKNTGIGSSLYGSPDSGYKKSGDKIALKVEPKFGIPTIDNGGGNESNFSIGGETKDLSRELFVVDSYILGRNPLSDDPDDKVLFDMGSIVTNTRVDGYQPVDFGNVGFSSDGGTYDPITQTPLWVDNYKIGYEYGYPDKNPSGRVFTTVDGDTEQVGKITKSAHVGKNTHPSSSDGNFPLAYLWLLSHGNNNGTGYYFFDDFRLSPANIFNFSPMGVRVPNGHPLLMGAILWRFKETNQLHDISPEHNGNDPIIFDQMTNFYRDGDVYKNCDKTQIPIRNTEYLATNNIPKSITLLNVGSYVEPKKTCKELMYLPTKFKEQLIQYFIDWVKGEFTGLLPIIDPINFPPLSTLTGDDWLNWFNYYGVSGNRIGFQNKTNRDEVESKIKPLHNVFYSSSSEDNKPLIVSTTPKSWVAINPNDFTDEYYLSALEFASYVTGFVDIVKKVGPSVQKGLENTVVEQEVDFNESTLDGDDIKLSLYRSFKSLYDKWISSSSSSNNRLFYNKTDEDKSLYDLFSFVNRGFKDIGHEAVIDITYLKTIADNPTMSLYQVIVEILSKNNFDFFPLPSYIRYDGSTNSTNSLVEMFKPVTDLNSITSSPSFMCMIRPGTSRVLDIKSVNSNCRGGGTNIEYGDDSFDITSVVEGTNSGDFDNDTKTSQSVTAFKVTYGQENQSHFKSIQLDQAEFKETQESLMAIDRMTKRKDGEGPSRTAKGNNLYDVQLTRSYTCTVEAFGNMMIQPLMYFKLENVPMFHGTYLITNVKHSVKPNNVSTTFTGVRQPLVAVPIVTDALSLMNISKSETKSGSGGSISDLNKNKTQGESTNQSVTESGMSEVNNLIPGGGVNPEEGVKYVKNLNPTQKNNINIIIDNLKKVGITQPKAHAAILAVISKESNLIPISEDFNYTAKRLTEVFPSKFRTEQDTVGFVNPSTKRADSDVYQRKLANTLYGDRYGNKNPNDGWDYRGRGFNQLTFKGSYESQKNNSGVDIVSNPELLNNSESAAKVVAAFMKKGIIDLKSSGKLLKYGATGPNDFQDITNAVFAYYHVNSGTGKSVSKIKESYTGALGGMKRAQERAPALLDYIIENGLS